MAIFGRNREEDYEDNSRLKDLKPENKKKRKEPPKPWGKRERYLVLIAFLSTVLISGILALTARDYKFPGLPRLKFSGFNLGSPFREETITIGKKRGGEIETEKKEKIINEFKEKTKNFSGVYALYVIDLKSGFSFGIDEDEMMQAASLIKLPVMLYAQGKVDDSKIEAMGKRSDNTVFTEMRKKFGDTTLQDYISSLGMANTSIVKNETTPKEVGDLFKKIYEQKNEKILGYLTDTIFENWLTKGVPNGVRVAHKYGREVHVVNDAGIVFAAKPYVIVIMTQGVVEKEADQAFPELSRLVYDKLNQ